MFRIDSILGSDLSDTRYDDGCVRNVVVMYNDVPCHYVGRCDREDEGAVGEDVKLRPVRLGEGEYTFVGAADAAIVIEATVRMTIA